MKPNHENKGLHLGGFTNASEPTEAHKGEAPARRTTQRAQRPANKEAPKPANKAAGDCEGCGGGS